MADRSIAAGDTLNKLRFEFNGTAEDIGDISGITDASGIIASATDVEQAYALGKAAVELALEGKNARMPIIVRKPTKKYSWTIGEALLKDVANVEKMMPRKYITRDGMHITEACREYLAPLIVGEDYPPYKNGLPQYVKLKNILVPKKLKKKFDV